MLSASITTLASFNGFDGSNPALGVILSGSTIYGLTGGNYGAINGSNLFSLPISGGTPRELASVDGPVVLSGGAFYGVAIFAGSSGDGDVFSLPISGGAPTVLASFDGADGTYPTSLIVSGNTIYGTTRSDLNQPGDVFSVPITGGTPTVLATFDPTTEGSLQPVLVISGSTLYGETSGGGASGDGQVFSLPAAGGTVAVLGSFGGGSGSDPNGNLIGSGSTLYGTTEDDAIFSLPEAGGTPTILTSLASVNLSGNVSLISSGDTLYGTAENGGGGDFQGGVFSVPATGGQATIMALFDSTDGAEPDGLAIAGNMLYGTAFTGGASQYAGTVFSLPVTATAAGLMVGADPASQTVDAGAGVSFSATPHGSPTPTVQWYVEQAGATTFTAIPGATSSTFDITHTTGSASGNQYEAVFTNSHGSVTTIPALLSVLSPATSIVSFDGTHGQSPSGIVVSGSTIYGVARSGGANGDGEVFSVPVTGGTPNVLASFDSADAGPIDLIVSGNTLYGMTFTSDSGSTTTVFSLPTSGGTPTVLASFSGGEDSQPGELVLSGNSLYGAVNNIVSSAYEIFSLPVTGGTPTIITSEPEGAYISSLAVSGSTVFASAASYGDAGAWVFSVPVTGGTATDLVWLAAGGEGQQATSLVVSGNTLFCSTAYSLGEGPGGGGDQEIFSLPTAGGTPTILYNFGINGNPGELVLSDGTLYGADGGNFVFALPASGGTPAPLAQLSSVPSDLILSGGTLYGALSGGGDNSDGDVFSIPVGTTPVVRASSTISLTSSHVPVYQGQHVTLTATVAGANGASGTPTGTVTFYDDGQAISAAEPVTDGTARFTDLALPVGADSITATYSGDADFAAASTASALIAVVRADPPSSTNTRTTPTIVSATTSASTHGFTIAASVVGADTGSGGAAGLTYTWTAIHLPAGAKKPTFNVNGINAATNIIARFSKDGGYILQCEVKNADGNSVTADVSVTVSQKATSLKIEPHDAHIAKDATLQFRGAVLDQFGHPMRTEQTLAYLVASGQGSISSSGLFSATSIAGHVTIELEADELSAMIGAIVG
jgi:uncharacterized repeat protein (TIGR03803 family)